MSTVNFVRFYFRAGMIPRDKQQLNSMAALAYQTARARRLYPKAILIGMSETSPADMVLQRKLMNRMPSIGPFCTKPPPCTACARKTPMPATSHSAIRTNNSSPATDIKLVMLILRGRRAGSYSSSLTRGQSLIRVK